MVVSLVAHSVPPALPADATPVAPAKSTFDWSAIAFGPGRLYAAVGGREVRIFEARARPRPVYDDDIVEVGEPEQPMTPRLIQLYLDPSLDEEFSTCAWSGHTVLFGGLKGVVTGVDVRSRKTMDRPLFGHGQRVNAIAVSLADPTLILTGSSDESVRLWNANTGALIALFGGERGHRGEVLHVAFDPTGENILSTGMDNSIRIWKLSSCRAEINASKSVKGSPDGYMVPTGMNWPKMKRKWSPKIVQLALFATRTVHPYFVDCAYFCGCMDTDNEFLVLSKSTHDYISLFVTQPTTDEGQRQLREIHIQGKQDVLAKLPYTGGSVWSTKFAICPAHKFVAIGNEWGEIFVFNLVAWGGSSPHLGHCIKLPEHGELPRGLVRQCAFSEDGTTLVAIGVRGIISEWDLTEARGRL